MKFADLDLNQYYTIVDYQKWQFEERVELIKGKIFPMAAPSSKHQILSGELGRLLGNFLYKKPCRVFSAPYDVYLPLPSKKDDTVVQPDLCVICDPTKIKTKGCVGVPDIMVEILSPSNNTKDINEKFNLYEEAGVQEYWIISPQDNIFWVNKLVDGKYVTAHPMAAGSIVTTPILPGFSIDLKEFFDTEL